MLMTDRSDRGSPKPRGAERLERDDLIWEANREVDQGQQPCCAARTGRTHGCIRPALVAKASCTAWAVHTGSTATSSHSYAGAGVHFITSSSMSMPRLRSRATCAKKPTP